MRLNDYHLSVRIYHSHEYQKYVERRYIDICDALPSIPNYTDVRIFYNSSQIIRIISWRAGGQTTYFNSLRRRPASFTNEVGCKTIHQTIMFAGSNVRCEFANKYLKLLEREVLNASK